MFMAFAIHSILVAAKQPFLQRTIDSFAYCVGVPRKNRCVARVIRGALSREASCPRTREGLNAVKCFTAFLLTLIESVLQNGRRRFLWSNHCACCLTSIMIFLPLRVPRTESFDHVFQPHAQPFLKSWRAQRHEVVWTVRQAVPLAKHSTIRLHRSQALFATHRCIEVGFLMNSAQSVALCFCLDFRSVGAHLTRQCIASDEVQSYAVQPSACRVQLFIYLFFDRAGRLAHLIHSISTRLWDFHTPRQRDFSKT